MSALPEKTVERLSLCRRVLLSQISDEKEFVFSYEIAQLLHITPVQVRRDLMLLGHTGSPSKGYKIDKLIKSISKKIDCREVRYAAVVGMGKLGHAMVRYLDNRREKLKIIAVFDNDPNLIGNMFSGVLCYHINDIPKLIDDLNISIGIITVPANSANQVKDLLVEGGMKGIVNYTPNPLKVPSKVYLEEHDIVTTLEKVSYFVKDSNKK